MRVCTSKISLSYPNFDPNKVYLPPIAGPPVNISPHYPNPAPTTAPYTALVINTNPALSPSL